MGDILIKIMVWSFAIYGMASFIDLIWLDTVCFIVKRDSQIKSVSQKSVDKTQLKIYNGFKMI